MPSSETLEFPKPTPQRHGIRDAPAPKRKPGANLSYPVSPVVPPGRTRASGPTDARPNVNLKFQLLASARLATYLEGVRVPRGKSVDYLGRSDRRTAGEVRDDVEDHAAILAAEQPPSTPLSYHTEDATPH